MRKLILIPIIFLMGCTYNVSMANVQGAASDVIDDTASNNPNISPDITANVRPTGV